MRSAASDACVCVSRARTGVSSAGDWEKLAAQIPDDVLDLFAAVGTFDELPEKVTARFGGISDTISVGFSLQSNAAAVSALVQKLQAIPIDLRDSHMIGQLLCDHERARLWRRARASSGA